ncbi:hypothetical+protein [Methylocapsa aurea]|uniref:NUDIX hydrolase n=1 Tax=Methylocapsa aurea TaxID=663610 RepID=UPI003D18871A
MTKMAYVVGFLFDGNCGRVTLIEKRRPAWMAGRLNGIGGKIEPGEAPLAAMYREGAEEIGVAPAWKPIAALDYPDAMVSVFGARSGNAFAAAQSQIDEPIVKCLVADLAWAGRAVTDVYFLVPLARHSLMYCHIYSPRLRMSEQPEIAEARLSERRGPTI